MQIILIEKKVTEEIGRIVTHQNLSLIPLTMSKENLEISHPVDSSHGHRPRDISCPIARKIDISQ